ncbi:MAG: DUF1697 domain-containing protein [Burkholderiales bacterium]|nr:MAG: DUF1697 domain-containing protein [Burkholderiales bacterium]
MTTQRQRYAALLRAVNVGGTGKLAMADLKTICERLKLEQVRTYIASGNVVFGSDLTESQIVLALEAALLKHMGKPVGVLVRNASELEAIVANNPFQDSPGNRVVALFMPTPPQPTEIAAATGRKDEQLALGCREIYIHYGAGMADSKLKIPAAARGTARNMNTVKKLAEMCAETA